MSGNRSHGGLVSRAISSKARYPVHHGPEVLNSVLKHPPTWEHLQDLYDWKDVQPWYVSSSRIKGVSQPHHIRISWSREGAHGSSGLSSPHKGLCPIYPLLLYVLGFFLPQFPRIQVRSYMLLASFLPQFPHIQVRSSWRASGGLQQRLGRLLLCFAHKLRFAMPNVNTSLLGPWILPWGSHPFSGRKFSCTV